MQAIENVMGKVGGFEVINIPLGQAILLLAGLGLNDILVPTLSKYLKMPILSGAAVSVGVKLPVVERFLGPTLSDVLAATAIATGIDEQFNLRNNIKASVQNILGKVGVSTKGTNLGAAIPEVTPSIAAIPESARRIIATMRVA